MSLSIDDLASSFSSSHIGQEALDLAALQAQLAQTLFAQSSRPRQVPRRSSYTQPSNTPTTSSSNFSFGQMVDAQRQQSTSGWCMESHAYDPRDELEQDEKMVEDLLIPSSPASRFSNSSPHIESSSSFTSADPFYMAQAQAAQDYNTPSNSAFSHYGHPSQQSPFTLQQSQSSSQHHNNFQYHSTPQNLSLDTHSLFVVTSAAFDR